MKKVFGDGVIKGNTVLSLDVFLQDDGRFTTIFTDAIGKKHKEKNLELDNISCHFINKEMIKQGILKNIDCKVFDVSYQTQKSVHCGFGGYRIAKKTHKLTNVSEWELRYYKDELNFQAVEKK